MTDSERKQKDKEDALLRADGWWHRKKTGRLREGYVHRCYPGRFSRGEALDILNMEEAE